MSYVHSSSNKMGSDNLHSQGQPSAKSSSASGPGQGSIQEWSERYSERDKVLRSLSSQGILAQAKINIMQQAVAKCPKVSISSKGVQMPSLLDSGSEVSLIHQSYFKEHLLPKIETPTCEKADAQYYLILW